MGLLPAQWTSMPGRCAGAACRGVSRIFSGILCALLGVLSPHNPKPLTLIPKSPKPSLKGPLESLGKADLSRRGLALLEEVEAPARKQAAGALFKGLGFRVRAPLKAPLGIKG